jgi:hypothetical protein
MRLETATHTASPVHAQSSLPGEIGRVLMNPRFKWVAVTRFVLFLLRPRSVSVLGVSSPPHFLLSANQASAPCFIPREGEFPAAKERFFHFVCLLYRRPLGQ